MAIDLTPPQAMQRAARDGLARHERGEGGDGLKPETIRRARRIARGDALTPAHVREMAGWFARHAETKPAGEIDPSPWYTAWQLWGGDAGQDWSRRMVDRMEGREGEEKALGSEGMAEGGALVADQMADEEAMAYAPAAAKYYPLDEANPYLVRKKGIVYGGRDLVGDTFTPETDLGRGRSFVGMPVYYDHAQGGLKSQIGQVVSAEDEDDGIVFAIELDRNHRYVNEVLGLERAKALGASTGAAGHLVRREGGTLKRWIVAEISLTPTPAEPRTLPDAMKAAPGDAAPAADPIDPPPAAEDAATDPEPTTQETPMSETATGAAAPVDYSADIAALTGKLDALTNDLDALKALPAAPPAPKAETLEITVPGNTAPGAMLQRYAGLKAVSYFGSPTREERYPDGVFGGFVKAVADAAARDYRVAADAVKALRDMYGSDRESPAAKALTSETGVQGGYTISPQFIPTLMQIAGMAGDGIYERALVIPSDGGDVIIPALDQSGSYTAGQSQFLGGVTIAWGNNDAAPTSTQPNFAQVILKTNAMKMYTPIANALLQRSAITIDAVVSMLLGNAIAWGRNYACFQGTGSGQPQGVINAPGTIDVAGSAIDFATLNGMTARMVPSRADNYVWYVHTLRRNDINALQATNNTLVTFLPDLRGKPGTQLMGLPVIYTDKLPYDSSDVSNSVVLMDPSAYVVSEFQGVQLAVSDQALFTSDQTAFRVVLSMDGQPWLKAPIKLGAGANDTVSTAIKI